MSNTNNTRIIYKVTCIPTSKVYVATSSYTNPVEAFNKAYDYTTKEKSITLEHELPDIDVDFIKYDKRKFKVELLDSNIPISETAFLKISYIRELAKELGDESLYNNTKNGNKKKSNNPNNPNPSVKHTYYAIASKHYIAITIFEDRYCEILKALKNKTSKYYEYNQESINFNMFDTYVKALVFIRKTLKTLTGDSYDESTIRRLCFKYRVVSVSMLSNQAMVLGYSSSMSLQQYSDMLQEERRRKTEKSMQEIVKLLHYN